MKNTSIRVSLIVALLSVAALIGLTGCDSAIESAYNEQIVVSAFLIAGSPIDSVILHRTTPFGAYYDDLDYAVDGAQVTVTVDGVSHLMHPGLIKGRYYLSSSELVVQAGKTYSLSITAPNQQAGGDHYLSATTTVPMPIHFTSLADSIRGKTFYLDSTQVSSFAFLAMATVTDTSDRRFLLSVTSEDTSFGRVSIRRGPENGDSTQKTRYSQVATGPAIPVTATLFTWYGHNRIAMNAIDSNWWDYQRQVGNFGGGSDYQPSLNHITGGMGIFGSASRDTVTVVLLPKQ